MSGHLQPAAACLLTLALWSFPATALDQQDIAALIKLRPSVLKVEASDAGGNVSVGTGVAVGPGIIATACHVTARATTIRVVSNGERMQVSSQRAQVGRDLCLLDVPGASQVPVVELRSTPLKPGEELVALGYILGVAPRVSSGLVLQLHPHDGASVIQSTTPFTSGASGGGLFDREHRLVGVMTFKFRSGTDNQFSLPVAWIREGMALPVGADVAPLSGQAFWSESEAALPAFLQTLRLQTEARWGELESRARLWIASNAADASAWHALGRSQVKQGRAVDGIAALERANALDADNPVFLTDLATAQLGQRDQAGYTRTRARLAELSPGALSLLDQRLQSCAVKSETEC
ncbi:trypsin-like peptidase domain-containing protein [Methyloversatilis sp.]|uniref:trypsin-like peptidase domain-containing protein n=1 Tax=Methyloversatilis sp. TaxID=2569862 RepID=UPI00273516A7|nr:trypsin-like peptidase domain-containing protein [Methyloversatilis sp.]MDP2870546.1 trypsin-like peptidase domain-containing protein [Methyloversatilis sp.]MDP3288419.1 trypsin-like peptidase domain-containing protein [Methyloversatilis sp.]MDP3457597.1 trypsin-like peptidase domain-containing protein [Methyloversatilis sp.]MDP3578397.1 trypsin-like peptidase domain-containing protein [Methyloversatilis sp.]